MDYKKKSFWLIICVSVGIVGWLGAASFGNVINSPYSAESDGNIGAWYDEVWDALGYYRLEKIPAMGPPGGSEAFRYSYTTAPTTSAPPIFRQGQAGILQDMTVTEWRVSGHVHFSGGM